MTGDLMSRNGVAALWELGRNHCRGITNLCISDSAKQLLINNDGFVPHLIDGLLLSPSHPRSDTPEEIKAIVQRCVQQRSAWAVIFAATLTVDRCCEQRLCRLHPAAFALPARM